MRIDFHCDKIQDNEVMLSYNMSSRVGKAIGSFFGFFNQKVNRQLSQADKDITKKVDTFGRESFSEETRSKWTSITDKASELNGQLTEMVKPIGTKIGEFTTEIENSYRNSNSTVIKGFRGTFRDIKSSHSKPRTQSTMATDSGTRLTKLIRWGRKGTKGTNATPAPLSSPRR